MNIYSSGGVNDQNSGWSEVEISLLRPGLILASDIYSEKHLLLSKNTAVTAGFIKALEKRMIYTVRVTTETADKLRNSEIEPVQTNIHVTEHIPQGLLVAIANELLKNEANIWLDAGIETAVDSKLLTESRRCVKDIFERLKNGSFVKVDVARGYLEEIIKQAKARPSAAVKLADVESFDEYTFHHSINVGLIFLVLAKGLFEKNNLIDLAMGALFHDIGKLMIPKKILFKQSKLTQEESAIVRKHVAHSAKILIDQGGFSTGAIEIALYHHEWWDGSGYPKKLKYGEISESVQLVEVGNVYDALTTTRCYRRKLDFTSAMNIIIKASGAQFSPEAVHRIWSTLGLYPIGSFIRLSSGEIAVVKNLNLDDITRPIVAVIYDSGYHRLSTPKLINLKSDRDIQILKTFAPRQEIS